MDLKTKKILIHDMIRNLEEDLLQAVDSCPEEWDGIELRWLLEEKAKDFVWKGFADKRNKRFKLYRNIVQVKNL